MHDYKYSVLMSVYKNDKSDFFNQSVGSMVKQTLPFFDFVLVCDGPLGEELDNDIRAWQRILKTRLQVVRLKDNHGLGYALNAGLLRCKCNTIVRMDADDISRPNRCEMQLKKMFAEQLDIVGGAIEEFDKSPGDMKIYRCPPLSQNSIKQWAKKRNPFNHMSVVFDKCSVNKAGGYETFYWMEDYWLWVRMIANGCSCANIPDVVVDVRTGNGMYRRRSGMAYIKSQIKFYQRLKKLKMINFWQQYYISMARIIMSLLPEKILKILYKNLLRTGSARKTK